MDKMKAALFASAGLAMLAAAYGVRADVPVGVTSAVNQDAKARLPGKATKTIALGDAVIRNQVIDTSGEGLVQVLLADGTAFTVGPNSSLVIDSFVYDPDAGTARVSASLSKGFMRFIGGRTSKTPGGATITTPIGTAGIRGAVVDIDLGSAAQGQRGGKGGKRKGGQGSDAPPHVSLIFGHEVTLTFDGSSRRLFQPGYSIVVDDGHRTIIRTPPAFLKSMQDHLAGHEGANGGVSTPPRDEQVRTSGVPNHNSESPLASNVPVPQTRPETPTAPETARAGLIEKAAADAIERATPGPVTPQPVSRTAAVRVLTPRAVQDGGGNGILGGSAETDRTGTLTGNEGEDGAVTLTGGTGFTLPVYADSAFTSHAVSGYLHEGATYSGRAYVGMDGFRAYMLTDGTNPLYTVSGTPTANVASAFSAAGTRHYSLSADALGALVTGGGAAVPFAFAPRYAGVDLTSAVSSDLLIAGTPGHSNIAAKGLQAWIVIDGAGASQKSAVGINTGAISLLADGASYGFSGARGGTDRLNALERTYAYRGDMASVAGGDGGTAIFGPNGDYLVLANDLENGSDGFVDRANYALLGPAQDVDFATAHVASLTSTDTAVSRSYGGRTLNGYSAITLALNGMPQLQAGTVRMSFNAADARFSATFSRFDVDANPYNDEIGFTDSYGGAVYLDDDNFASAGSNNRSYVVNSRVAPVRIFDGGTSSELCNCAYMSWGWWGRADTADGNVSSGHMGNWVIGDVTANVDLPASGSATYSGHAVGSVVDGGAQYIATGDMSATMDFSARTGNVAITGFDGRDFNSNVSFASSSTFTGANGATSITGSFASDGAAAAQGVMGAFSTSDGAWAATGIFGGNRN